MLPSAQATTTEKKKMSGTVAGGMTNCTVLPQRGHSNGRMLIPSVRERIFTGC